MRRLLCPPVLSALLALALYAITLGGVFIYDDVAVIQTDRRIADPRLWGQYWTDSYNFGVDNLYRPIVSMSYAIQYYVHGPKPFPFHLVNWLLHALASALVAQFAIKLAERSEIQSRDAKWIGLIAGLLFAAHPVHVEAVANVVGRAELLCAIGVIGAMLLFLRRLTPASVLGIYACFILALLSKEQGMLVPLLLGLVVVVHSGPIALWQMLRMKAGARFGPTTKADLQPAASDVEPSPRDRAAAPVLSYQSPREKSQNHAAILFFLLAVTLGGYVVYRESILKFWWDKNFLDTWIQPLAAPGVTATDRLLVPIAIAGRYLQLLVAPVTLRLDYGGTIVPGRFDAHDPYFYSGLLAIVLWLGLMSLAAVKRDRFSMLCLLSFAFVYGLLGNLVSIIGVNLAERLMYLPSVFFILLVARWLSRLPRSAMLGILVCVIFAFSIRTVSYAWRWNDKLGFYQYSAEVEPRSVKSIQLATLELLDHGRLEEAEQSARRAIAVRPDADDVYLQLARVLIRQKRWDEALEAIGKAQHLNPAGAWGNTLTQLQAAKASEPIP